MSGLTDAFYTEITAFYKQHLLDAPRSYYRTGDPPAVWFEPCQVWEIRGAELTLSPVHKAGVGLVDKQRGMSLRFPRFLRVRDDKGVVRLTPTHPPTHAATCPPIHLPTYSSSN